MTQPMTQPTTQPTTRPTVTPAASTTTPTAAPDVATASAVKRKPTRDRASVIRAAVARKMVESASVPQFTVWRDIVLDDANGRRQGLSWTTVLLRAYAAAMRDVPELLCRWENETATPSGPPSVALAVATPGGLMVPVFSEPDTAAPRELDAEVKSVVAAVQKGRLDPAYLGVANGSLSNLGGLGVDRFQALVTPPQASVLALGSIKQRPVAVPGGVGVALTVTAGVTVDHRVADGAHAATLLERFAAHIG
jgi:pyruvate dehydrogenase E2 component (dihydrolipoamide acetyltransferase)